MEKALDNSSVLGTGKSYQMGRLFAERMSDEQVKSPIMSCFLKNTMMKTGLSSAVCKMLQLSFERGDPKHPPMPRSIYTVKFRSMNIQYARLLTKSSCLRLGSCPYLYNGPNAHSILTPSKSASKDSPQRQIYNHIDHKDRSGALKTNQDCCA